MLRYILSIIFGILIFILWNRYNVEKFIGDYYLVGYENDDRSNRIFKLILADSLDDYLIKIFNTQENPTNPGSRPNDFSPFSIYGYMGIDWNDLLQNGTITILENDSDQVIDLTNDGKTQQELMDDIRDLINNHFGLTTTQFGEFGDRPNLNPSVVSLFHDATFGEFDWQPISFNSNMGDLNDAQRRYLLGLGFNNNFETPTTDRLSQDDRVWLMRNGFDRDWIEVIIVILASSEPAPAPAAGPFCNPIQPNVMCASSPSGGGGGGGMTHNPEISESVVPHILENVSEDTRPDAPAQIIVKDCRYVTADVIELVENLKLKYTLNGITYPLEHVSYLNSGQYGVVCKYSSADGMTAIAVKFYKKNNNSEARTIRMINSNVDFKDCNTVTAEVLEYNIANPLTVGLMELMDGDLDSYFKVNMRDSSRDVLFTNIKFIMKQIVIDLKCISDASYLYTDLKLLNVLYKIIDGVPIVRLGDLDSIVSIYEPFTFTYGSIELNTRFRHLETAFNDADIYWAIGCTLLKTFEYTNLSIWFTEFIIKTDQQNVLKYLDRPEVYYATITEEDRFKSISRYIPPELFEVLNITLCQERDRVQMVDGLEGYDRLIRLFS